VPMATGNKETWENLRLNMTILLLGEAQGTRWA
jgi:hypothetical protein